VALPRAYAAEPPHPALIDDLATTNRILYEQGVIEGSGHVSARHDKAPSRP
jgi:HCOMODA/2-hydroxy-3-carboxy-muconic semialdehyde decarboxylase